MTVTYRNLSTLPPPIGLYSHVARAGTLAFFAGMAAIDADGTIIGKDDLETQMRAMYTEMGDALKAEGLTYSNVVQMTTYLVREQDIAEFYRVRELVYQEIYPDGKFPPNALLIVSRLVDPDLLIELQITAAAD
ncbi:MAG: RidA family protein [Candidatus Dormibacteria bacterium]